jgi:hypothetical protein
VWGTQKARNDSSLARGRPARGRDGADSADLGICERDQGSSVASVRVFCFALLLCLVAVAPPLAAQSLYAGEAPVIDQSDEQRTIAMSAALAQVVVKLTGDANVVSREAVAKALTEAERYVQRYSYRQDVVTDNGQPVARLALVAQFDRGAIDRLLRDFGLKSFSGARPPVLTFLVAEDGGEPRLILDANKPEAAALLANAQQRGLNLVLPNLGEDQAVIGAQTAWSGDVASLLPLAAKLQTNLVLIGQLRRLGEQWSAHWTLSDGNAPQSWDAPIGDLSSVLAAGSSGLAERVVGRYNSAGLERRITNTVVWISGLSSAEDYARALGALSHDQLVREVQPQQARGDGMLVKLTLNVALEPWLANLAADNPLRAVSARPPIEGVEATLAFVH